MDKELTELVKQAKSVAVKKGHNMQIAKRSFLEDDAVATSHCLKCKKELTISVIRNIFEGEAINDICTK